MNVTGNQQTATTHRYLLIAGTPKAATTSLFRYLTDHPEICGANRKETYFFARDFDNKNVCQVEDTLAAFESYFAYGDGTEKVRVEATPYTLYSQNSVSKIANILTDVQILVVLRDPIERFISDFRFRKQRSLPEVQDKSFTEYSTTLLAKQGDENNPLLVGRYIDYLHPFYETFGEERVTVLFYEELKANLLAEMKQLCRCLGIVPEFYDSYQFNVHNRTINVRYRWLNQLRMNLEPQVATLRKVALHHPVAHRLFEQAVDVGRTVFSRFNHQQGAIDVSLSPEIRRALLDYYCPLNQALSKKLARPLPWKSFTPSPLASQ
ncbi:MAG: sulfotransferase [Caldilineaceae bacterium]